jgi:hypothetical protein
LTAKTEKAKKNGLSSPFLIFTADAIIAKIRPDLKGVALCRQIARPAAQTRPTGAVGSLAPDDAVSGLKHSPSWGKNGNPGAEGAAYTSSATTLEAAPKTGYLDLPKREASHGGKTPPRPNAVVSTVIPAFAAPHPG